MRRRNVRSGDLDGIKRHSSAISLDMRKSINFDDLSKNKTFSLYIDISMNPVLKDNDKLMFYKLLDKATVYFEYGCGGSTYQANIRNNIVKIYSVESDMEWIERLKQQIKSDKVVFLYNEMDTRPKTHGNPGENSTVAQRIEYSNKIINLSKDERQKIDLVLIDGRFRVACCLKCFDVIGPDCLIAFDDFYIRRQYHIVLNYYDVVEKTQDEHMVILKKKNNITSIPAHVIKKYELISD